MLDGLLTIEENAFRGCTSLEKIELPSTVKRIGANAFAGCSALKEVVLPEEVKYLGSNIFDTPELKIYPNILEDEVPATWATDWHTATTVIEWGKYKDIIAKEEIQDKKKK